MILLLAFIGGFGFGWVRAGKRGGNRLDKLQYGAGHGIFALLVAFAAILLLANTGVIGAG